MIKELCSLPNANCASDDIDGPSSSLGQVFGCDLCRYVCLSAQQLGLHAFKAHGIIREARHFIGADNSCPACMHRYPTRTQTLRHMCSSAKCSGYAELCDEVHPDEVEMLDSAETLRLQALASKGVKDCCALRTLSTCQGPLRKEFQQCFKGRPRYKVEVPVYEKCPAEHFQSCSPKCLMCMGT